MAARSGAGWGRAFEEINRIGPGFRAINRIFHFHMFHGLELWVYPLLFLTGCFAGTVDTIAGGGGIITLPVLLSLGMPVQVALGTNKLQASFGSVSASWHFVREGAVRLRGCAFGIFFTFVGAVAGARAIQRIDSRVLGMLIPWLLCAIVVYSILRPRFGEKDRPSRWPEPLFFLVFGLGLGFYDGFFGPGTGSFWTMALVLVPGYNFIKATACTKVMNATSNVASLAIFFGAGHVDFIIGILMGAGQVIGARIGSRLVVTRGAKFARPVFLTMVVAVMLNVLYKYFVKGHL